MTNPPLMRRHYQEETKKESQVDQMIEWLEERRDEIDKATKIKVELHGKEGDKVRGSYTIFE